MNKRFIPLSVPEIRGNEWSYIKECLDTNWISYVGPFVERFEKDLAECCGAQYAVATASGTAALHLGLLLAGVDSDSEVVMPAITFVAPANAVRYCGAWPAFIDIRQSDWQMDIDKLADFLRNGCTISSGQMINKATGRRVSALLPVHLMGDMCDVDAVLELAAEFHLPVVEDAAECVGATYKNRGIGAASPASGNITRFIATSFNGNKIVTTGGGGALLTNDAALARRAKHISTTAKADPIAFYHDDIGYNYRLNNVCAALGVAQLEKLDEYVAIKRRIAARYAEAFAGTQAITPHPASTHANPTYWLYTVMLDRPARPIVDALNADGIQSRPIWVPMHKLPMFTSCWRHSSEFADQFHEHALSLPCSVGLSDDDLAFSVEKVLEHATADMRVPVAS
jgi:perosamine synthetase